MRPDQHGAAGAHTEAAGSDPELAQVVAALEALPPSELRDLLAGVVFTSAIGFPEVAAELRSIPATLWSDALITLAVSEWVKEGE